MITDRRRSGKAAARDAGNDLRGGARSPRAQEVLAAATHLFSERGYAASSVRAIARKLGIQSSSLYHHFDNKQAILFEACRRILDEFNHEMLPLLDAPKSPAERIRDAIRFSVLFQARRQTEVLVTTQSLRSLSPEHRAVLAQARRRYRAALVDVLKQAVKDGSFALLNPALAARLMIDVISAIAQWYRADGAWSIAAIADSYERALMAAFSRWDAGLEAPTMLASAATDGRKSAAPRAPRRSRA